MSQLEDLVKETRIKVNKRLAKRKMFLIIEFVSVFVIYTLIAKLTSVGEKIDRDLSFYIMIPFGFMIVHNVLEIVNMGKAFKHRREKSIFVQMLLIIIALIVSIPTIFYFIILNDNLKVF